MSLKDCLSIFDNCSPPQSILWDVEKGFKVTEFMGHEGDVMTISLGADNDVFVSGSVDKTAKVRVLIYSKRLS